MRYVSTIRTHTFRLLISGNSSPLRPNMSAANRGRATPGGRKRGREDDPPSSSALEEHFRRDRLGAKKAPVIIVCPNAEEAKRVSQMQNKALTAYGEVIEVIPQP